MTTAILAAFTREIRPVLRQLQGRQRLRVPGVRAWVGRFGTRRVVLAVVGMGPERAEAGLSALRAPNLSELLGEVDGVVSVGYVGALDPELRLGDLVVAERVLTPRGEQFASDAAWVAHAERILGGKLGAVVSVDKVVEHPKDKHALYADPCWSTRPLALDMESAAIAREAERQGLRFLGLKVVLDCAHEALRITPSKLFWLIRASKKASERLSEGLRVLCGDHPPQTLLVNRMLNRLKPWVFGPLEAPDARVRIRPLYPLYVSGYENLPRGGFILACNHQSWLDVCVVYAACPFRVRYLTKHELFEVPGVGWLMRYEGNLPVVRGTPEGLDRAIAALRAGAVVAMFPEGTIPGEEAVPKSAVLPETGLLPGKTGAVRLALASGVPLVPAGITGTGRALPVEVVPHLQGLPIPRRGIPLELRFGAPLELTAYAGHQEDPRALREATDRLMHAIARLVNEPSRVIEGKDARSLV